MIVTFLQKGGEININVPVIDIDYRYIKYFMSDLLIYSLLSIEYDKTQMIYQYFYPSKYVLCLYIQMKNKKS